MLEKLQAWLKNEPVRAYLYGLLAPVLALLVGLGVITDSLATSITAVAAAVLLVPAGALLRSKVTPDDRKPMTDETGTVWFPVLGDRDGWTHFSQQGSVVWPERDPDVTG